MTIIGLGSPWGDDRVGWCVADALGQRLTASQARISKLDRPGAGLLEQIAGRRQVLLVDAAVTGARAGSLHSLSLQRLSASAATASSASSHGFGLVEALALGNSLGLLPALLRLYLISIDPPRAESADTQLSAAVAAAVAPLAAIICRRLRHQTGLSRSMPIADRCSAFRARSGSGSGERGTP